MAVLHVKSPNGTTQTLNMGTSNITNNKSTGTGYVKFSNGIIFIWFFGGSYTEPITLKARLGMACTTRHASSYVYVQGPDISASGYNPHTAGASHLPMTGVRIKKSDCALTLDAYASRWIVIGYYL